MTDREFNTILDTYIRDYLSPKKEERDLISARYDELRNMLEGDAFQSGSYARFTSTTPVNDLDIIWVLPSQFLQKVIKPEELKPESILTNLATNLRNEYRRLGKRVRIEPQSHSVGIYFGKSDDEFSIDIVPAIPSGKKNEFGDDTYYVPEIARLSKNRRRKKYFDHEDIAWIKSDPKGYIMFAQSLNDENESFRKVAKFTRAWRRGCKNNFEKFPLKSFHLELIVADVFQKSSRADTYSAIESVFKNLERYLSSPRFQDRADSTKYIDEYLHSLADAEKRMATIFIKSGHIFLQMIKVAKSIDEISALLDRFVSGEEFIEAHGVTMALDSRFILKIDGWVRQRDGGFRAHWLKPVGGKVVWKRAIDFQVTNSNLPQETIFKWKVKNDGDEARKNIRLEAK